jgi:hypothetical protein
MKLKKFQKNRKKTIEVKTDLKAGQADICACPLILRPVCAVRTYANECVAECDGATVLANGECL